MKSKKILVTGGSGLIGKSLKKILPEATFLSSKDYDLTNQNEVNKMFLEHQPKVVIHMAALVGGIIDNINRPYEYFYKNIMMNTLVLEYSHRYKVENFLGILSTCIYPDTYNEYPLKEDTLHLGPPTISNFGYGYAKRCLAVQIDTLNKQFGTNYSYIIPCNLYGPDDKDDEKNSHFVTALIKKIYLSKKQKEKSITLYGDGTPLRQFMLVEDLSKIIKLIIDNNINLNMNIATDETYSIDEIANIALEACDALDLCIDYDKTKPNGQYRKDVSISKFKSVIPNFKFTNLKDGIKLVYQNYILNEKN